MPRRHAMRRPAKWIFQFAQTSASRPHFGEHIMRKIFLAFAFSAALVSRALADWTGKDASNNTITFKNSGTCSSVVCVPIAEPVDSTGAAFGVTGNPFFMTAASGAIASGAFASGSLASGAGTDGWNVTEGAKADSAYAGSGSASIVAILKGLYSSTTSPIPTQAESVVIGGVGLTATSSSALSMSHAVSASAGVTSLVAKASAGNIYGYNCTAISGAAAGFCVIYNGTSAPSTGALTAANVVDFCYFDTTARGCSLSRIPMQINSSSGIVALITSASTPFTYTTGTLTGAISVDYK
jgi:hypothetical protein